MRFGKTENNYTFKFINFVFALLISFNCATFVACQKQQNSNELREKCEAFSDGKNPEKAADCYEQLIKLDKLDGGAYIFLADEYKQLNQLDKAEKAIKRGIELRPNRPSAYKTYGDILERKNDLQGALEQHKQAVRLDPKSDIYWIYLALIQEKLSENEEAVNSYNQILTINPDRTLALYKLGKLYEKLEKPDKAIEVYEKLLEIEIRFDDAEERLKTLKAKQLTENQTEKQTPKKGKSKKIPKGLAGSTVN